RTPEGVLRVEEERLLRCPVVVLCVAISAMPEVLKRIAPRLAAGSLVMDTCSVKEMPAAWMRSILPPSVQILATHPMFGPDSAVAGLSGLPMVLCPIRITARELERWHAAFAALGLAVRRMSAEEHDREAAVTQGLTHFVGRFLAEMDLRESPIGSVGYRKLLEIIEQTCHDSWQLFLDLQRYNPHTREMRRRLEEALGAVRARLDAAHLDPGPPGPPGPGSP
ncbi:MAG: prephenate dehydrogenase/arogenate dehydrogenase family protein, partial [Spirochaetales bacterium]|nr:prephenate dehydrogenase/arogenate dehydrogenase family protein [Spirochaetales bacterium]